MENASQKPFALLANPLRVLVRRVASTSSSHLLICESENIPAILCLQGNVNVTELYIR